DDVLELLVLHPHQEVVACHPGIVDEDVELAAERFDGLRDETVDRCAIGEVAGQPNMIAAKRAAKRLQLLDVAPRYGEPRALPCKRLRNGTSKPARGARHQGSHSAQVEHHAISLASASTCSIVTALVTLASGAMRLTIGPSTLPPSSTNSCTPASNMFAM